MRCVTYKGAIMKSRKRRAAQGLFKRIPMKAIVPHTKTNNFLDTYTYII